MIKTNILQYTRLYIELVKAKIYLVKDYEVLKVQRLWSGRALWTHQRYNCAWTCHVDSTRNLKPGIVLLRGVVWRTSEHAPCERSDDVTEGGFFKVDLWGWPLINGLPFDYSKLRNMTLVANKVHVIFRSYVVLTWMRDKYIISVVCDIME